jgi:uncharacterized membrane protein
LTIILATTAMLWNIIYNFGFDRFWPVQRVTRTAKVRALHALGFECGFIVIGVSIVAAVLGVTLLQAFTLEIGFFLFFLPYTMFYNWAYDNLREKFLSVASNDAPWQANALWPDACSGQTPTKQLRSTSIIMVNCTPF